LKSRSEYTGVLSPSENLQTNILAAVRDMRPTMLQENLKNTSLTNSTVTQSNPNQIEANMQKKK